MNGYPGHVDQLFGGSSFSQHADDMLIANIFFLLGIDKPSYLDVGAGHPTHLSNTKLLYDRGSRGITVDANPNLEEGFKLERPDCPHCVVGITLEAGEADFYMFDAMSGRNTFSKEEAERFMAEEPQFKITEVRKIPVVTLALLFKFILPDFLSLDIEGLDFAVLENTTFPMAGPIVICVEARRHETAKYKAMMAPKGYRLYVRMGDNLIFVREEYMEALE